MYPFTHTFDYQQSTTFGFIGTYRINGIASPLHGLAISAKIRDSNECLICQAVVTFIDIEKGVFYITLPESVRLPLTALFMDIRVEGMGVKRVTKQIVKINVVKVVSDG